jgi:hypothetical protein
VALKNHLGPSASSPPLEEGEEVNHEAT